MNFDTLIKNGTVIDPDSGRHERADVAFIRGRIAAVDRDIPVDRAGEAYDAAGCVVTPGLIDLHSHVFHKMTSVGIDPEAVGARTGVTTWVDAGSAGAYTITGFRDFIVRPALVRIYAFMNISCIGLIAYDFELTHAAYSNPHLFELMLKGNRDLVIGGKVRLGASTVGENGYEPLKIARQALERSGLPLMLHIARRPPDPEDFADLLREGDVLTHCYTGQSMKLVDDNGKVRDFAKAWLDRGVIFDVGHGQGSFTYNTVTAMLAANIKPHTISSDIHLGSIPGPMFDLPTCLNKFMALGMSLDDVIARATVAPARLLGMEREIGTLRIGAFADVAVFDLDSGPVELYDTDWETKPLKEALRNRATFVSGRLLPRRPEEPMPEFTKWTRGGRYDWIAEKQEEVARKGHAPRMAPPLGTL
jgi:dihydroorotase